MRNNCYSHEESWVPSPRHSKSNSSYLEKPTIEDKENYADDLFKYTGNDDDSDLFDFKIPPLPKKMTKPKTNKPTATAPNPNLDKNDIDILPTDDIDKALIPMETLK